MAKSKAETVPAGGLMYVGNGAYIPGVPARDLTVEEAEKFGPTIAEYDTTASGPLYVETLGEPAEWSQEE
jgi:hypothetical protein